MTQPAFSPINPWGPRVVATAGTPVLLFPEALASPGAQGVWPTRVSRIYIEALNSNTGLIYIGVNGMVKATGVKVIQTIPAPAAAQIVNFAAWLEMLGGGSNNYKLSDYWIDAAVNGEGVIRTTWIF